MTIPLAVHMSGRAMFFMWF